MNDVQRMILSFSQICFDPPAWQNAVSWEKQQGKENRNKQFSFQESNGTDGSCVFLDGQDSIISEYKWNQPAFQVMKTSDKPFLSAKRSSSRICDIWVSVYLYLITQVKICLSTFKFIHMNGSVGKIGQNSTKSSILSIPSSWNP